MEVIINDQLLQSELKKFIMQRKSVRSFLDKPVTDDQFKPVMDYIDLINKEQFSFKIIISKEPSKLLKPLLFTFIKRVQRTIMFEILKDEPNTLIQCGIYGELLVLKLEQFGFGTVWMMGDKFFFSSAKARETFGTENRIPICIPVGWPPENDGKLRSRGSLKEMTEKCEADEATFQLLIRAPSAINQQPYCFSADKELARIFIRAKAPEKWMKTEMNQVDMGIVAAHAMLINGGKTKVEETGIAVSK